MEKSSATKIVSQTFQNPFDKESFVYFIKSLLNHIDPAPFIYRGNFIPDIYKPYIKTLERIGKYQDRDDKKIDLLIVHLKKETSLERARTMQRNFIAWYLNGSRGDILKDAALVAFVSPNSDEWRFSLVKMDYRLDASGEKVKVKQELTPARRLSFLVGKTESSHTAQSRLVPILQDDNRDPSLEDMEEAFSIEKVTKEFFEKYHELFLKVKETLDEVIKKDKKVKQDFEEKDIDTVNFAKKLLGQIVFLYFLQKKGWFGVERDEDWGTGPKNFLRLLFEKRIAKYDNFFNEILESLFYEALAVERTDDFYSRFNCKIPFLNGGLFDPINNYDWIHTDILLPNELFSNSIKTKEGDVGTGILDIFDRYNFTVKEDEPLEKEVAIDPEMLGKVFENLLEVKDRKSKGTYYTPREIVHYMCQQSLINYLKTETKIEEEKIERIVKQDVLFTKDEYLKWKKEKQKPRSKVLVLWEGEWEVLDKALENIRIVDPACGSGAFLVGMLQEIVKARRLLQLFNNQKESIYTIKEKSIKNSIYGVDIDPGAVEIAKLRLWLSLIVEEEDIKQIRPLPNLDYKIICGNSLLGVKRDLLNFPLFDKLEKLKPLFFNETNNRKKQEYKNQIDELISKITNGHKDFDFEVYFSEVFHEKKGFDVVIANPPYIRQEEINCKTALQKEYEIFNSVSDLYTYFYERGFKLLKNFGVLTFITSNKFLRARYGAVLRKYLKINTSIKGIVNFGDKHVFEAITNTLIFIATKEKPENNVFNYSDEIEIPDKIRFLQSELQDSEWTIERPEVIHLKRKIKEIGKPLRDWDIKINRGVLTGYNEAFIIDDKIKNELIKKDPKSEEIIKPIIRGRDIKRYHHVNSGQYLIVTHNGYRSADNEAVKAIDINEYPSIKSHLDKYIRELKERQDKGVTIYNLRDCAFMDDFTKEKIIWIELTNENRFVYSNKENYLLAGAFLMVGKSLKYLLSFLNSKLCHFYFSLICNSSGMATIQWKKFALEKVPVMELADKEQKPFVNLIDKILAITKDKDYLQNKAKQKKVKEYEKQIDQLVYKLYGLTKEEIKIVEKNE